MELKLLYNRNCKHNPSLLIVPYGIETDTNLIKKTVEIPFNRTLWN